MSCNDIPSLLDLQKAKLNADDFGRLMGTGTGTSTNGVTGQVRPTYNKVINDMNSEFDGQILNMGFTRIGTFAAGATLINPRQTLLWDIADGGDGQEYGWSGEFPKVVPEASAPSSTGGISVGAWISRFDPDLRIQVREALRRSYAEAGYTLVDGSFENGGTLNSAEDVLLYEAQGVAYSWGGQFLKVVPAGSTPDTTGGIGEGAWLSHLDPELRDYVLNTSTVTFKSEFGYSAVDNMIAGRVKGVAGFITHEVGKIYTTGGTTWEVGEDLIFIPRGKLHVKDFGAVGDGVTDDSDAIQSAMDYAMPDGTSITPEYPLVSNVHFDAGRYRITRTINIPRGVKITGDSAKTQRTCNLLMDSLTNIPIFDLFGCELSDGKRVADQTISGLHFTNNSGYAIRAVSADYAQVTSYGSIAIKDCHFLGCNGDYAVQVGYLELVTNNTFDYCQVGHIKTIAISTCSGNIFYRGIGGALVFDSAFDGYSATQISNVTGNAFYECGTASGMADSAICGKGGGTLPGWNVTGNTFIGSASAGVNNVCLNSDTTLNVLNFVGNTTSGTKSVLRIVGLVKSASVCSNQTVNTTGTTSSHYNMLISNAEYLNASGNVFSNTSNIYDINVGGNGLHNVFDNITSKVSVGVTANFRGMGSEQIEERYNVGKLQRMQDESVGAVGQVWQVKTSQYARLSSNGFTSPTWNNSATILNVTKNSSTNRSINAGGTVNTSGADYAEYMIKSDRCGEIHKGDICGVDVNGMLTDRFDESISFVIKSTDPSFVGGDTWFTEKEPSVPLDADGEGGQLCPVYLEALSAYKQRLEDARSLVDRIAFSGQVPCNVFGAKPGDYIVPARNEDGTIGGKPVSGPTPDEYHISVGKVWRVLDDDRAFVAVKIA